MSVKNLIVGGCSYSAGHLLPIEQTWGGFVANKKQWNMHNIARGGSDNEWISQKVITYIENNKNLKLNSVVMVGWSDMGRMLGIFQPTPFVTPILRTIRSHDFVISETAFVGEYKYNHEKESLLNYNAYVKKYGSILLPFFSNYTYCVMKTYLAIFNLKTYLQYNKIPYIFFDAVNQNRLISVINKGNIRQDEYEITFKDGHGEDITITELVPNELVIYFDKGFESTIFDDDRYINFNGHSMLTEMIKTDIKKFTEGNENHPNSIASDYFSDIIIEKYNKLYE